ncbi:dethiobiotin synthase [Vibrio ezurae]|uniref:ATP-dependent dethiobiotin synthetase BioD n=1 Tax=Vibrio ezurae NBRC 102218 TaxID=1219080 RepID=U3CCE7_9VIBR|nr:dethiobiotin synthase [Vibrio ezurae]GAD78984.1 ATP-dependent dethiobiotin synthetase BioD [Vibrio ezurae NBRC 102218]
MKKTFFVAGTDTDVGKTVVSRGLLQALQAKGFSTIGFKPIAAGCESTEQGLRNSDALYLQAAATVDLPYEEVNPVALLTPASPHIAAPIDNTDIDTEFFSQKLHQHQENADVVLVEGAGGWRVPIGAGCYLSQWAVTEKLPVILVVGVKLGCLNHAVLTAEAIRNDGLEVVGWVANRVNPCEEYYQEIIAFLQDHIGAPKIGEIPYMRSVKKKDISEYINLDAIL